MCPFFRGNSNLLESNFASQSTPLELEAYEYSNAFVDLLTEHTAAQIVDVI